MKLKQKKQKLQMKPKSNRKRQITNIYSPIGRNQLIGLTTWGSRKRFSEESMAMVLTSHPPSSPKVFCQSSKVTILLPR